MMGLYKGLPLCYIPADASGRTHFSIWDHKDRSLNLHNRGHQFLNININNLYINNSGRKRNIQE